MKEKNSLILSKKINKSDKYIPVEILRKILDQVDNVRDEAYIMYHVETGLRVTDVIHTEKVHLDIQNYRTYTYDYKKDKWRWVYWPEKVKSVIKKWYKQMQIEGIKSKYLFPFSEKTANRIIKKWSKAVNFQYADLVSSHWLRHTFIRLSRKRGRDIKAVQQNTGDTIKTLLEWYSDLSSEDMRDEIESKSLLDSPT